MINKNKQILLTQLRQHGICDERLLYAIESVPSEFFVDEALEHKAYENTALPIGIGANYLTALHSRADDRATAIEKNVTGARNWYGFGLSNRRSGAFGRTSLLC